MALPNLVEWDWWLRWYVVLNITDEGTYGEDQVPEDYGGPVLQIQQNHVMLLVTKSGYMQRMELTMGWETILDKDRNAGIGFTVEPFEDLIDVGIFDPIGPSAIYVPVYLQERPGDHFSDNDKAVFRELLKSTILHDIP